MPGRPATEIHHNNDGSIAVSYKPTEPGSHEVSVHYNDHQIDGSPFRCLVDKVGGGYVTAYGAGLTSGASGSDCQFSVVGGGDPEIKVEGPGKAEIKNKEHKGGVTNFTYVPVSPGEYEVQIKVKGKHIHGSPFSAKISGEGRKRSQWANAATSEVSLGCKSIDLANATGIIKTPSGAKEPCLLKKMPDGKLGIANFNPKSRGMYHVEVTLDGHGAPGSPFKVSVGDREMCKSGYVKMSGAIKTAKANTWNIVEIDITDAGYGSLGLSVEGPHRSDIECKATAPTKYSMQYKPHEPGIYLLNFRFGDDHVTGSPYMITVGGEPSGRVRETISRSVAAVSAVSPGEKCEFQLTIPGTDPLDMEATLTAPSGKSELCEIRDLPHSLYDIKFIPNEEGIHTVSLKHKGLHISGSPFQYTVGSLPVDPMVHKVEIGGPGLEHGEVGARNDFNVYTREAGGGELTLSVEGPSKAKFDVVDRGHGYTTVTYIVSKPGDYGVHVKYEGQHVPDSPARVYIAPDSADAKSVTVHGIRDRGLEPNKPVTFHVNLNGVRGDIHAHMDTPSGTEEDVFVTMLDKDMHAVRFTPKENGVFYVHLKFQEAHIMGSPFAMMVGKMGADPALVLAKGEGLETGTSGKAAKFVVATTNAGAGTLNVGIEGASRCAIVCTEVEDGYEFAYTPMAPGEYLINIKFANVTIAGCPTKSVITGKGKASDIIETSSLVVETVEKKPGVSKAKRFIGDASKVVAKGNGLNKGFANRPGTFTIDVKDAGQSLMIVALITPTGNPAEEITVKKTRATIYTVIYKTKEKGEHNLVVRWGSDDIPGSPFSLPIG